MKIAIYSNDSLKFRENGRPNSASVTHANTLANAGYDVSIFYDNDLNNDLTSLRSFVYASPGKPLDFQKSGVLLSDIDILFLKRDTPSPLFLDYLKHSLENQIPVVNGTNMYETHNKKYCNHFSEFMPPTIYSNDCSKILSVISEYDTAILKPLNLGSGRGIEKVSSDTANLESLVINKTKDGTEEIVVQKYLPSVVADGDKRVIAFMSDNEIRTFSPYTRFAANGDFRCNVAMGGTIKIDDNYASKRELEVIESIAPKLISDGVRIVGVDFISENMTEINTVNPGYAVRPDLEEKFGLSEMIPAFTRELVNGGSQ